ncbi:MAG: MFS transporter [Candidatus Thorarchaeota archaeon]
MNRSLFLTIISVSITWLITALVLLVYSFEYLDTINQSIVKPYLDLKTLLLILTATVAIISLLLTANFIDKKTAYLKNLFVINLGIAIICLISIGTFLETTIISISFILLGVSLGGLTACSGAIFGGYTKRQNRAKVYSYGIGLFALLSVIIISFLNLSGDVNSTKSAMYIIAVIGIIYLIMFIIIGEPVKTWQNDAWPTKLNQILDRRTLQSYLITHFILYLMIGLAIQAISATGQLLALNNTLLENFDIVDLFWAIVFLSDLIVCLLAGYFVDRLQNRKNVLIFAIYGIAIAILIFDLEQSFLTYFLSAILLGASVAFVHVTLDSSIWADLAPRDALGRYFAFGFTTLILGVSLGYGFGLALKYIWGIHAINVAGLILILLGALSMFPLFFVADTAKPLNFTLLLVIFRDGMPCFSYSKSPLKTNIDLPLIAGALQAISSFMSETIDRDSQLSLVQHGDYLIVSEFQHNLTAAIFVNKGDKEIRIKLKQFLHTFFNKFEKELDNWYGDTRAFSDAYVIVEEIFGPLLSAEDFDGN